MYQEVCFNRGTEAAGGGGVNVGHSLSPPVIYACYGPAFLCYTGKCFGNFIKYEYNSFPGLGTLYSKFF